MGNVTVPIKRVTGRVRFGRVTKEVLVTLAPRVEMAGHLGHDKSGEVTNDTANTRNGHSAKTIKGDFGALPLDIPRDRQGRFDPQIVGKHQTRWTGFDDKIISLYARGLSVGEIQSQLEEIQNGPPETLSSAVDGAHVVCGTRLPVTH